MFAAVGRWRARPERRLRSMNKGFEAGLKLSHLLVVHGEFPQDLRVFDLCFQDLCLCSLAEAIASEASLNQRLQDCVVSLENREGGLEIGESQIDGLYLVCDGNAQGVCLRVY